MERKAGDSGPVHKSGFDRQIKNDTFHALFIRPQQAASMPEDVQEF
jgi:hypothetical protein